MPRDSALIIEIRLTQTRVSIFFSLIPDGVDKINAR